MWVCGWCSPRLQVLQFRGLPFLERTKEGPRLTFPLLDLPRSTPTIFLLPTLHSTLAARPSSMDTLPLSILYRAPTCLPPSPPKPNSHNSMATIRSRSRGPSPFSLEKVTVHRPPTTDDRPPATHGRLRYPLPHHFPSTLADNPFRTRHSSPGTSRGLGFLFFILSHIYSRFPVLVPKVRLLRLLHGFLSPIVHPIPRLIRFSSSPIAIHFFRPLRFGSFSTNPLLLCPTSHRISICVCVCSCTPTQCNITALPTRFQ